MASAMVLGIDPPDLQPWVNEIRTATGTDFAMGAFCCRDSPMVLSTFAGALTTAFRDHVVAPGTGLGGKALATGRPVWVADYFRATGITHDHDGPVRREGLRSAVAVPFALPTGTRGVVYAAVRRPMPLGDRVLDTAVSVIQRMERDAAVAAEVQRRLAECASAVPGEGSVRDQCLRDVQAELVLLRKSVETPVQTRIDVLLDRIGTAMHHGREAKQSSVSLSKQELAVLTQVATGATNAAVAERLCLAPETVKAYLKSASGKLGASNRLDAVTIARRSGLLP